MKTAVIVGLLLLIAAAATIRAGDRPTLDSLVGREWIVEDDWAGQSLAIKRKGDSLFAIWRVLGSGRPVLSEAEYPIKMTSPWQGVFEVRLRDDSRNVVKVAVGEAAELLVYLNGVRILLRENTPHESPEPTVPAVNGSAK